MAEDSFILLSLKESKAKKIALAISNETCKKILEFLSKKEDATETEIAKELSIPLSTVHYNMKQLSEAGLVRVEEFHYSEKGKEVDHYKIANKLVVIAPETTAMESLKEKLGKIIPVAIVALAGSGLIYFFTNTGRGVMAAAEKSEQMLAAPKAAAEAEPNIALWFLIGSFVAIITYLLVDFIRKKST